MLNKRFCAGFLLACTLFLLVAATSGNIEWTQLRSAARHGNGTAGQSSDGTGTSGNCAKFDGTGNVVDAGAPCGTGTSLNFADNETPSGTINSSNVTFTLAHTPSPGASVNLYVNGVLQLAGGTDFTLATATITFANAPTTGDWIRASYRY